MIPITPDIIGPGIEEEYADLEPRVEFLLNTWKGREPSNKTAHGRIVFFMLWLKQELTAQRIPIPLNRSYLGTIKYLIGSGELLESESVNITLEQIGNILQGRSLVKPRHIPVVTAMINDFINEMHRRRPDVANDSFLLKLQNKRDDLVAGRLVLPLPDKEANSFDQESGTSSCIYLAPGGALDLDADKALTRILMPFLGITPYPARKPPMVAPCPGLPIIASDMSVVRDRDSESRKQ